MELSRPARHAVLAVRRVAVLLVVLVLVAAASSSARAGRLVAERFASPTLGRDWDYLAYLPDGYEVPTLQYPVLYLLHGYAQDHYEWVTKGKVHRLADRMILAAEIPPCIIIMPSAGSSWYVDAKERLETAFVRDLIPEVERRYRTIPDRLGRVIGGVSMGGYGALRFTLRYPELFAAVALFSPGIYTPEPPATSSARWAPPFQRDGRFDPEIWRSLNYPASLDAFLAKNVVVPLHVNAGDHDEFQTEYHAAVLYKFWRDHAWPAEFRVVAGEHNFGVWRQTAEDALRFVFETVRRAELIARSGAEQAGP